jgi:hypothetical protein
MINGLYLLTHNICSIGVIIYLTNFALLRKKYYFPTHLYEENEYKLHRKEKLTEGIFWILFLIGKFLLTVFWITILVEFILKLISNTSFSFTHYVK